MLWIGVGGLQTDRKSPFIDKLPFSPTAGHVLGVYEVICLLCFYYHDAFHLLNCSMVLTLLSPSRPTGLLNDMFFCCFQKWKRVTTEESSMPLVFNAHGVRLRRHYWNYCGGKSPIWDELCCVLVAWSWLRRPHQSHREPRFLKRGSPGCRKALIIQPTPPL